MSETTTATKHVVKAGGAKGTAIVELASKDKSLTRAQIAEAVGATVGRVGEVVRWLAVNGTATEQKAIAHLVAQPRVKGETAKSAPAKKAVAAKAAQTKGPAAPRGAAKKAADAKKLATTGATAEGEAAYTKATELQAAGEEVPADLKAAANEYAKAKRVRRIK